MTAFHRWLPALTLAALVAARVAAQEAPEAPAPPPDELVAVALAQSPTVAAVTARLAAAAEMVEPAGALPEPMVELMLQNEGLTDWTVGDMPMSMIGPEVSQRLPWPGKREARREAARAAVEIRAGEVEQVRRRLAAAVHTLYAELYARDQERAELRAAGELLDLLNETALTRYAVGETDQAAVLSAQLELTRLGERVEDLAAERAALVAALDRLLDRSGGVPLGEVRALPPVTPPPPPWEETAVVAAADVAVARAAVGAAEKQLEVARLDLRPDFTTGAGVGVRGGLDPVLTLRGGVEWPLWRRAKQEPMLRAAEYELAMARAELRAAAADARAEAARLASEWTRAERQIVRYREAVLPQTSAVVDAARVAYLAGQGDFATVLEAFRRWLEARSGLARRQADRYVVAAELAALVGELPRTEE